MTKKKGTGRLPIYRTYVFRDKDPVIDKLRTARDDQKMSISEISNLSGVSESCMNGWWNGVTLRPQHATIAAVAGAMGGRFELMFDLPAKAPKAKKGPAKFPPLLRK